MKKLLFIIPLVAIFVFLPVSKVHASEVYTYIIVEGGFFGDFYALLIKGSPTPVIKWHSSEVHEPVVQGKYCASDSFSNYDDAYNWLYDQQIYYDSISYDPPNVETYLAGSTFTSIVALGPYDNQLGIVIPVAPDPNAPPIPVIGDQWLDDMWNWFLWQFGINDDYSGDIDAYITGGDRDRIELVTPTPTPLPPSPTPIVMPITDTNGNTIWNVTYPQGDGGGGDTTNNYYGDDFDIFDVDLKIGDGGTSNPRDGLNDVMDSSFDYVNELDTSAVSGSFSILPTDWYVMIGVLICFPFIAGFISKLLK